jgi:hypothetical protein
MYSIFSASGFVSSKRKWHLPPYFFAKPKLLQIDFAWPRCKYPFGSGGNLRNRKHSAVMELHWFY